MTQMTEDLRVDLKQLIVEEIRRHPHYQSVPARDIATDVVPAIELWAIKNGLVT